MCNPHNHLCCHTTQVADHKALQRRTTLEHSDALDLLRNEHAHHKAELFTQLHQLESSLHTAQVFFLSVYFLIVVLFCVWSFLRESTNSSPLFTRRRFFLPCLFFKCGFFFMCAAVYLYPQTQILSSRRAGFLPLFFFNFTYGFFSVCEALATSCATSTRTTRHKVSSRESTSSNPLFTLRRFFSFVISPPFLLLIHVGSLLCMELSTRIHQLESSLHTAVSSFFYPSVCLPSLYAELST